MPRTFIAAPIAAEYWPKLKIVQQQLQLAGFRYRLIRPENFHMTVAFLGEFENQVLSELYTTVKPAISTTKPIRLQTKSVTGFPSKVKTRALAVKLGGRNVTKLQRQASKIRHHLQRYDIWFDDVPFVPHITIGRTSRGQDFSHFLPTTIDETDVLISGFGLYVSTVSEAGVYHYQPVEAYLRSV